MITQTIFLNAPQIENGGVINEPKIQTGQLGLPNFSNIKLKEHENKEINVEDENKNFQKLKNVNGALEFFQTKKKDKILSSNPKYLSDLTQNILYDANCQTFLNKIGNTHIRLPLIIISYEYFNEFVNFLNNYYLYSQFKENPYLIKYLITANNNIKNYIPNHKPRNQKHILVGECVNTDSIKHYNEHQLRAIRDGLNTYFIQNGIRGIEIDLYFNRWINTVFDIFSQFILFHKYQTPISTYCEKCQKIAIFIEYGFNINNSNNTSLFDAIDEDMKNNETYPISINIANNIIINMDFSNVHLEQNLKNLNDNGSMNIIYYDENMNVNMKEILKDSFLFEKECKGTFLLIPDIKSFSLILNEFILFNVFPKFHLICTGSKFENLMTFLRKYNNIYNIIVAALIYTMNENKYTYLRGKYGIIKGIFSHPQNIVEYIRKNKIRNNKKYKIFKVIRFDEYNEKYIQLHKIISLQYGKLYQKSSYITALNMFEEFILSNKEKISDLYDIEEIKSQLTVFSTGPKDYKQIIKEYTNDSFYSLFNKWMNETDPLAISKIAFFISGLQLSLNIYGYIEKKGFNNKAQIYRGSILKYSEVLKFLQNIGNIITFPSFFSTTLDFGIAKYFSRFTEPKETRYGLFSIIYIININPRNGWISQGFNISELSYHQLEKEILFQPFCFFKLTQVKIEIENYLCYIHLELLGKKEIWELSLRMTNNIFYKPVENILELNKVLITNNIK